MSRKKKKLKPWNFVKVDAFVVQSVHMNIHIFLNWHKLQMMQKINKQVQPNYITCINDFKDLNSTGFPASLLSRNCNILWSFCEMSPCTLTSKETPRLWVRFPEKATTDKMYFFG